MQLYNCQSQDNFSTLNITLNCQQTKISSCHWSYLIQGLLPIRSKRYRQFFLRGSYSEATDSKYITIALLENGSVTSTPDIDFGC